MRSLRSICSYEQRHIDVGTNRGATYFSQSCPLALGSRVSCRAATRTALVYRTCSVNGGKAIPSIKIAPLLVGWRMGAASLAAW